MVFYLDFCARWPQGQCRPDYIVNLLVSYHSKSLSCNHLCNNPKAETMLFFNPFVLVALWYLILQNHCCNNPCNNPKAETMLFFNPFVLLARWHLILQNHCCNNPCNNPVAETMLFFNPFVLFARWHLILQNQLNCNHSCNRPNKT